MSRGIDTHGAGRYLSTTLLILSLGGCGSGELPIVGTWNALTLTEGGAGGLVTTTFPSIDPVEGGTNTSYLHLSVDEELTAELLWTTVFERSGGAARRVEKVATPGTASEVREGAFLVTLEPAAEPINLVCTFPDSKKRLDCGQPATDFGAVFERASP